MIENNEQINHTPILKNKYLLLTLALLLVIHTVLATIAQRGIFADAALDMLKILDALSNGDLGFSYRINSPHPRAIINFFYQLPVNIAYFVFNVHNKQTLMSIFSMSMFASPLLALFYNFHISARAKRWDIAIIGLSFYLLFILPSSLYSVVETRLAVPLYMILLNYLACNIEYKKYDLLIISILLITLFNSHEIVLFVGLFYFIVSLHYAKKAETRAEKKVKRLIGNVSLVAAIYMAYCFYTLPLVGEGVRFSDEFLMSLKVIFGGSIGITSLLSFTLLMSCLVYKKYYSVFIKAALILLYAALFIFFYSNLDQYINHSFFSLRTWACFFLPGALLFVYVNDRLNFKLNNIFFSNLLTIVCLTGMIYTMWQINHTYLFHKDYTFFSSNIKKINKPLIRYSKVKNLYNRRELRIYHTSDTLIAESILFSKSYKIKTVVLPPRNIDDPSYKFYVDKKDRNLNTPFMANIDIKNRFWDLTKVSETLEKNKSFEIR